MTGDPYRALVEMEDRRPSCPCGMSEETKQAFQAIGGWQHTKECLAWQEREAERRSGLRARTDRWR